MGQVFLPPDPFLPPPALPTAGLGMEGELSGGGDPGTLYSGEDQLRQRGAVHTNHQQRHGG